MMRRLRKTCCSAVKIEKEAFYSKASSIYS